LKAWLEEPFDELVGFVDEFVEPIFVVGFCGVFEVPIRLCINGD
jgi:hypothetical protein